MKRFKNIYLLRPFQSFFCFTLLLACTGCRYPSAPAYQQQYTHLKNRQAFFPLMRESAFFLVILVDARHLDYSQTDSLLRTIAKHPSDGSKNGDVGHAWIYLQGMLDGKSVSIEGGHSGEMGNIQPKYFEGIMNYVHYGYAHPNKNQRQNPRNEPNPVKYLWTHLKDGFFQKGRGHHIPTYAVKIDLSQSQFEDVLKFMQPENYFFKNYALTGNQCSTFVAKVAALAGLPLEHSITMNLAQTVAFQGQQYILWRDPSYSKITFSSPDIIERSLMHAVAQGQAEYALPWYLDRIRAGL